MEIKIYNTETLPSSKSNGLCQISLGKTGVVTLSHALVDTLGLATGEGVEFGESAEGKDWYIFKSHSTKAFITREKQGTKIFIFNNVSLVNHLQLAANFPEKKTLKLKVSKQPTDYNGVKYYAILLNSWK